MIVPFCPDPSTEDSHEPVRDCRGTSQADRSRARSGRSPTRPSQSIPAIRCAARLTPHNHSQKPGLKPPKGILLYGPPGTGKTHLARAIAQSTDASLLVISGAELASAFHGETEARLRAVFADARRRSPCIIVLDEVDAMCPRREESTGGGGVEARVVATLLTEMDGISSTEPRKQPRIVVVATTNRPNAIDPALRRPGRFDREIEIGESTGPIMAPLSPEISRRILPSRMTCGTFFSPIYRDARLHHAQTK